MKPNPYVNDEVAHSAYTKLALSQLSVLSSFTFFGLSLFKIYPKLSLSSAFKKFTVFQSICGLGMIFSYIYDL
jgi:hypothetical protein